jgi:hypothetical protein
LKPGDEDPAARSLWSLYAGKRPDQPLPAEGFLLEIGPQGALILAGDPAGERWARQALERISGGRKKAPRMRLADWPDFPLRGFHLIPYTPAALPAMKRLVAEVLAPFRCNFFVFEIDYSFDFKSHPEVRPEVFFTKDQIRDFVEYCRGFGIRVIPEINCLGHQSWKAEGIGALLKAHPEFEEIPDGKAPHTDLSKPDFYCRSWCPLHPGVNPLVFDLMDELIDAFQSDGFHVGMDEVFVLASSKCPRCKGKNPAELYAKAVKDLYGHLKARGQQVFMWGDRLLSAKDLGESEWQASANGTDGAVPLIPKDIVVCDWHYTWQEDYRSLDVLLASGFPVMPTTYNSPPGTARFVEKARERDNPGILGPLTTVWFSALEAAAEAFPDETAYRGLNAFTGEPLPAGELRPLNGGGQAILRSVKVGLAGGWNPAAMEGRLYPPYAWQGPWKVPGKLQAEDFDEGGPESAYHDADALNEGGQYRSGGVDIASVGGEEPGFSVGWVADGDWTAHSLDVRKAGTYTVRFRIASQGGGGRIRLELDGADTGAVLSVPDTGGWSQWQVLSVPGLVLPKGRHRLRLIAEKGRYNLDYLDFVR